MAVFHLVLAASQTPATAPRAFGLPAPSCTSCVASCGIGVLLVCCRQAPRVRQVCTGRAFDGVAGPLHVSALIVEFEYSCFVFVSRSSRFYRCESSEKYLSPVGVVILAIAMPFRS